MCNIADAYDMKLFTNDNTYEEEAFAQPPDPSKLYRPAEMFSTQGAFKTYSDIMNEYPSSFDSAPSDNNVRLETQPLPYDVGDIAQDGEYEMDSDDRRMLINKCNINSVKPTKTEFSRKQPITPQITNGLKKSCSAGNCQLTNNKSTDEIVKKNKHNKLFDLTVGMRETVCITLIGILIIFLLDILIRVGKKL